LANSVSVRPHQGLRIIRAERVYSAAEVDGSPATAISTLVRTVRED